MLRHPLPLHLHGFLARVLHGFLAIRRHHRIHRLNLDRHLLLRGRRDGGAVMQGRERDDGHRELPVDQPVLQLRRQLHRQNELRPPRQRFRARTAATALRPRSDVHSEAPLVARRPHRAPSLNRHAHSLPSWGDSCGSQLVLNVDVKEGALSEIDGRRKPDGALELRCDLALDVEWVSHHRTHAHRLFGAEGALAEAQLYPRAAQQLALVLAARPATDDATGAAALPAPVETQDGNDQIRCDRRLEQREHVARHWLNYRDKGAGRRIQSEFDVEVGVDGVPDKGGRVYGYRTFLERGWEIGR
mmetsp:Transcript_22018/g.71179  ORF Transcript_22018/g.71179 Transcript_22018/m.71179 type:complete len:302 (-) Transcript_22018:198-1103(-)